MRENLFTISLVMLQQKLQQDSLKQLS